MIFCRQLNIFLGILIYWLRDQVPKTLDNLNFLNWCRIVLPRVSHAWYARWSIFAGPSGIFQCTSRLMLQQTCCFLPGPQVAAISSVAFIQYLFCIYTLIENPILWIHYRWSKSYSLVPAFSNQMCSRLLGTHRCTKWRYRLLAYKSGLGNGADYAVFMFSKWCYFSPLSWISPWAWLWKICSGDHEQTAFFRWK